MPHIRKPKSSPAPVTPAPVVNGSSGEVLTLAEAAAYLRLPEAGVITAAMTQGLPGRLIGGEWRFLKGAVQQWLSIAQPTAEMRKAAVLAMAGQFKDDPDLLRICEDVYRQRGRPITEDGSYDLLHGLEPAK